MNPQPMPQLESEDAPPASEDVRVRVALDSDSLAQSREVIEATRDEEEDLEEQEIYDINQALAAGIPLEAALAGERAPRQSQVVPSMVQEPAKPALPIAQNYIQNGKLNTLLYARTPHGFMPVCASVSYSDIGFEAANDITAQKLESKTISEAQRLAAGSLVRRARQGDQNAMATIAMVTENASKGDTNAQATFGHLREYISSHPMSDFGEEIMPVNKLDWQIGMLACGAPLTDAKLNELISSLNERERAAFKAAFSRKMGANVDTLFAGEIEKSAYEMGLAFAQARRIQEVRQPNSNLRKFHPVIAWELGQ